MAHSAYGAHLIARCPEGARELRPRALVLHSLAMPAIAESAASSLPGTDEFIERCERVRARDYVVRAAAQAALRRGEGSGPKATD